MSMMIHDCPECGQEMEIVTALVEWGSPTDTYPRQMDVPVCYECGCGYSEDIDPEDVADYDYYGYGVSWGTGW